MEIVLTVGTVIRVLLRVFTLVLWARLVLDWVVVLNRRFRPRGALAVLVEVVYTVTDPPIRMFRRVLPPIRLGAVALDLGWMLTMLACWLAIGLLGPISWW